MRSSTTRSGRSRSHSADAARAVAGDLDRVALAAQARGDGFGDRLLVLDHHDRADQPVSRAARCKRGHTEDTDLEVTRPATWRSPARGLWRRVCRSRWLASGSWPDLPIPRRSPGRSRRRAATERSTGCAGSRAARRARPGRSISCAPTAAATASSCGAIRARTAARSDRSTEYRLLEAAAAAGVAVPRVRMLLRRRRRARTRLRHGPRRGRDDPAPDPPRRRVRRRPTPPRRAVRRDRGPHPRDRPGRVARAPGAGRRRAARPVPGDSSTPSASRIPRSSSGCAGSPSACPPPPPAPELVHGDFRNGNFIVGADGIRAVLDWELAHLGDPVEDLGWLCVKSWRFGVADRLVGGFGDVPDLLDAYERAGGRAVDEDDAAVLGRARHAEVGRDLRRPGVHPPQRARAFGRARDARAAASPRPNGTCSTSSTEVGDRWPRTDRPRPSSSRRCASSSSAT